MSRRGTVLMETLLTLPLLAALAFAIVQFSLVWYAQLMTHYAAFNAARAALVYNPSEYRTNVNGVVVFKTSSGPCWQAAVRTLAPVSFSPAGGSSKLTAGGWFFPDADGNPTHLLPYASHIGAQVRLLAHDTDASYGEDGDTQSLACEEGGGYVKVCVEFDFPLVVPVIGKMLAYFQHVGDPGYGGATPADDWQVTGWHAPSTGNEKLAEIRSAHRLGTDYLTLHAFCVLPKPYLTNGFAVRDTKADEEALQ
ncbi:MAG: TadE/TadG family type IV pilus assembly protein [Kiritimatiellia bacterium]